MPNIIQFRLYLTKLLQKKTVPLFYGSHYIKHFTRHGGSVYAASLDIRKAFDTVNHY